MDDDAALAEKIFAVAGRLLDASTLSNNERALEVARTTAQIARTLLQEPDEGWRAIARCILQAEDLGAQAAEQQMRARSQ